VAGAEVALAVTGLEGGVEGSVVYNIVIQTIDPDRRDEYIERYTEMWRKAAFPGCRSTKVFRSLRDPSRVIIIFEWESEEAHRAANATPEHDELMRETVRKYQTARSDSGPYEAEEI
jgi:heme-degrading monooxygenase HmoA